MSSDEPPARKPLRRPRKISSGGAEVFAEWAITASARDYYAVAEALLSIQDDSWAERYEWTYDVTKKNVVQLHLRPGLAIIFRIPIEYPGYFEVFRIGPPPPAPAI